MEAPFLDELMTPVDDISVIRGEFGGGWQGTFCGSLAGIVSDTASRSDGSITLPAGQGDTTFRLHLWKKDMWEWLRASRQKIEEEMVGSPEWWCFSPSFYAHYVTVMPLINRYVQGSVIDLGCGLMPFRDVLIQREVLYHSLDLRPRSSAVTCVGDVQHMPLLTASYDSAICFEVLEHIPHPFQAVREIHRILKPGGVVIFSVPYLSRLHDQPHDYFRFTVYGLRLLFEEAGFEVLGIQAKGGIIAFLGHQISTLLLSIGWPVWGVRQAVWFLNKWLITYWLYRIDRALKTSDFFALGYVGVAQKGH